MALTFAAGLLEPVLDAQRTFRAVMAALSRPGTVETLRTDLDPPAPLTPELAAIALTLADHEAPLWLDAPLLRTWEAAEYVRFHSGAPIVADPSEAAVALVVDPARCPPFESFALGTPEYPDRSTLIVLAVSDLAAAPGFSMRGPGIAEMAHLRATPLPADMSMRHKLNGALFPCGVDLLLVASGRVAGLPRTTEILEI